MKTLFILEKPHSIVDIITNSSTEIFVSSTDKTVEFIQEWLEDASTLMGMDHGVGEIYQLTDSNIKSFVEEFHYYIDFGSLVDEYSYRGGVNYEQYKENWWKKEFDKVKREWVGKIVIVGKGSNSIPYELFDLINSKFKCVNYHLG